MTKTSLLVGSIALHAVLGTVVLGNVMPAWATPILATPPISSSVGDGSSYAQCTVFYVGTAVTGATASVTLTLYDDGGVAVGTNSCNGPFNPHHDICFASTPFLGDNHAIYCEAAIKGVSLSKARATLEMRNGTTVYQTVASTVAGAR